MNPSASWLKTRTRLIGVVFLLVLGLLIWLSLALYNQQFTSVDMVTLHTDSTGNEMHLDAQVMVRGVQVGEVRSISADGSGAVMSLAIQPGMVSRLPANVTAEMMPTTLFGERYVALILPSHPVTARLTSGTVIHQDSSRDAVEVEQVLNNLEPMLTAVQPQDLDVTLTAISTALQGRGGELGHTLVQLNAYLRKFNLNLPALDKDITELVQVARTYTQAAPSIVQALNDFTVTSETIVAQQESLGSLYTTLTQATQDVNTFLGQNSGNIIGLSSNGLPSLRILARYSSEFPCVLRDLRRFIHDMNKALGAGTGQPGLHATVTVQQPQTNAADPLGQYTAGHDTPAYRDDTGPHCYPVPLGNVPLNDGASRPTNFGTQLTSSGVSTQGGGVSLANSAQENEFVNELSGAALGVRPASLPDWSSLLVGPVYRGREVRLR
jgi:phospholipid/cholesterol/gamma-HCH transport system substrate-binding protein